jgi:hypothetical protein
MIDCLCPSVFVVFVFDLMSFIVSVTFFFFNAMTDKIDRQTQRRRRKRTHHANTSKSREKEKRSSTRFIDLTRRVDVHLNKIDEEKEKEKKVIRNEAR